MHIILYYSIGFTESTLKFWRQISQSGGLSIEIIKPNGEKKFKALNFYATVKREEQTK